MATHDELMRVARAARDGMIERERVLGGEARARLLRVDYDDARLMEYVAPFARETESEVLRAREALRAFGCEVRDHCWDVWGSSETRAKDDVPDEHVEALSLWHSPPTAASEPAPEPEGRCQGCGDMVPMSAVDSVGGHCVARDDGRGHQEPVHCGPVDAPEPAGESAASDPGCDFCGILPSEGPCRLCRGCIRSLERENEPCPPDPTPPAESAPAAPQAESDLSPGEGKIGKIAESAPEGGEVRCRWCGNEIDPDVCWCGGAIDAHIMGDGHAPVPMGCDCHREPAPAAPQATAEGGLRIKCGFCGEQLTAPGALLFSPPDDNSRCTKLHSCLRCFNWLLQSPPAHASNVHLAAAVAAEREACARIAEGEAQHEGGRDACDHVAQLIRDRAAQAGR